MTDKISEVTDPGSAPLKTFFRVAVLVFLLVFGLSVIVTFLIPDSFTSTARIKVERDASPSPGQNASPGTLSGYDPFFIQTEFEVIQSEVVLGKVIESLDLNSVWGKKYGGGTKLKSPESLTVLKGRMELRPVRNTSLIEIRVFSEDRDEAARIANAIAESYREYRNTESQQLSLGAVKTLEVRHKEQADRIRKAESELEQLRNTLGISEIDAQGSAPSPTMEPDTLHRLQAQLAESSTRANELRLSLAKLKTLSKDELKQVLPRARPDQLLTELISRLNQAEQELVGVERTFSPSHPQYIRVKDQVDVLKKKVDQSIVGVMAALANQLDVAEEGVAMMKKQMEDAKRSDIAKAEASRPYYGKKRELEEMQGFARILDMKLASEKIDMALPKSSLVELIDRAVAGLRPVRPNKPLNLFLGACGGILLALLVGGGAALVVSQIRKRAHGQAAPS
jgi:succinoglycan biosynthesis transport protein ExoP